MKTERNDFPFRWVPFWLCMFLFTKAFSQDAHFSQFYEAPLLLNPARAGFINGTYQLNGVYRSQWTDITLPFKSLSGTAQFSLPQGINKNNIIGIGVTDFADKAGDGAYNTNNIGLDVAYHRNFGKDFHHYLGAAVMMGFATSTFDLSKLTFDEDFMGGTNTENISSAKASYTDLSVGVEYNYLDEGYHFNAGFAVYHLNKPVISYDDNSLSVVYRKFVLDLGYAGKLYKQIDVIPRFALYFQGPFSEVELGGDLKYRITQNSSGNYSVYGGVYYRPGDAFIPKFRIDMGDLSFGFSYDFTTSKLARLSSTAGGPELTLIYVGRLKGISVGRIYNPRF